MAPNAHHSDVDSVKQDDTISHYSRTDEPILDAVRLAVRDMLMGVPAFQQLSREEQRSFAESTMKVMSYLARLDRLASEKSTKAMTGTTPDQLVAQPALARLQPDAVEATKRA